MELEVLYHGTKLKKTADLILKHGFDKWSYFATDLNTAIGQGGKYVFEVVFVKSELPVNWQVRCENRIPATRIIQLTKYNKEEVLVSKSTQKWVYEHCLEFSGNTAYCFQESVKTKRFFFQIV